MGHLNEPNRMTVTRPPYAATGRQRQPSEARIDGSRPTRNQLHNLLPAPTNDRLSHEMVHGSGHSVLELCRVVAAVKLPEPDGKA
jgi:hypothetical protein